ncbi:MAG: hypothetical protein OHK0040_00620 [bacterium]
MLENTESFFEKALNFLAKPEAEKAGLILLFLVALGVRLFHIKSAFVLGDDKILFIQPDAYYHIRRSILFANNFPSLNSFDYYLSYPVGAECPWPPLYDWVIAVVALILNFGHVNNFTVELLHATFPVLTAAFSIFPVYFIVKTIWKSKVAAFLSAFFFTFAPNPLSYSVFISGDHHSAELFLAICFYYYAVKALEGILSNAFSKRHDYLAGLMAALGLLVWHIQIFYFTLWLIFVLVAVLFKRRDAIFVKALLVTTTRIFTVPIIIVGVIRILSPMVTEQGVLSFDFFSFFQPLYMLLLLLPVIYLYLYYSVNSRRVFLFYSLLIAVFVVAGAFMFTPILSAVKVMQVFFAKSEPYLTNISEYNPLFKKGHFMWGGFYTVKNYLMFFYYAMPAIFALFYFFRIYRRKGIEEKVLLLLPVLLLFIATSILQFYQKRWGNENGLGLGVAHGVIIYSTWIWVKRLRGRQVFSLVAVIVYIALFIAPISNSTFQLFYKLVTPIGQDIFYTLKWIKENTPKTSYYLNPTKKPEYGIMTPWDIGHLTIYYGERPVSASNFGHSLRGTGFKDSLAIWQVTDDKDLAKICERNEAKFLIISDPIGYMTGLENMKFFYPYPAMRLMQFDGSFSGFGPALEHFRLIYESYTRSINTYHLTDVRMYKVYEFVKGARVSGRTYPLDEVKFTCTFRSDKGREFKWSMKAFSDEKGNFSCVIPYATANVKYAVRAMEPFKAVSRNKERIFNIDEKDVQKGNEIKLNFL